MARSQGNIPARLRTPRAAGIAGVLFSVLLGVALVLIGVSIPSEPSEAEEWLTDPSTRGAVAVALNLVPFAGIAFLWFIGVIRDRIGQHEDRLFATAFLGSGLLFVAMLFVATAVAASLLADPAMEAGQTPSPEIWGLVRRITFTVLNLYAIRMSAIFILTTTAIGKRTGFLPRWLVVVGMAVGLVLLVGPGFSMWVSLVLPTWTLILSLHFLFRDAQVPVDRQGTERIRLSPNPDGG